MGHHKHHHKGSKFRCIKKAMKAAIKHLAENAVDDVCFGGVPVCELLEPMRHHDRNNHGSDKVGEKVADFLTDHGFLEL
jgi:hypothetical protein